MKDDLSTLLAHETDDVVPAEHERLIREGLGSLLTGAPVTAPPPVDAALPRAPAAPAAATLKVTTAALLGLGLAAGGFALGRATAPEPLPPPPTVVATSVVPPAAPSAPTPPEASSASASASPPGSASAVIPSVPKAPTPASPSAFDREQSLLERARAALVRHDASAAAEALDALDAQFPTSRHGEERDYLRIQLLRERGDTAAVRERARAFLAAHPDSLLRARVEPLAR